MSSTETSETSVLKARDCNVLQDNSLSPPRKRVKADCKGMTPRWSLSEPDILAEMGVGILETDDGTDEGTLPDSACSQDDSSCTSLPDDDQSRPPSRSCEQHSKSYLDASRDFENFFICRRSSHVKSRIDWFSKLSDEMVLMIFRWLPKISLSTCALVCKRWKRLSEDESLWTRLDCSFKTIEAGSLGHIVSRQVVVLRLLETRIMEPAFLAPAKALAEDFTSKLIYLDLTMASVSARSLQALFARCHRLKKLSLEACTVDDATCAQLAHNDHLEILNMSMVTGLRLAGIQAVLNNCKRLKELNISWTGMSSDCLRFVCRHIPETLDRLNVSGCRKTLDNNHVADLVECAPNLRELDLSDCTELTEDVVNYVLSFGQLQFLALSRCYGIHYTCLNKLKRIKSLLYLNIHGTYKEHELERVKEALGSGVQINEFFFSSVARPTVGPQRSSIWGLRVRD